VSAITTHIITSERDHFHRWMGGIKYLWRGRALVFSQSELDERAQKIKQTLEMWEYDPEWKHLDTTEETLESGKKHLIQPSLAFSHFDFAVSLNGVFISEGSLFVVVIGPIVDVQSPSSYPGQPPIKELALRQGDKLVPLGSLTQKFVASKCPSLGGKPKVFIFLNTNRVTDHAELAEVM
jgi:hypothetical protein